MKFLGLTLGALGLASLTFGQMGTTTTVYTMTHNMDDYGGGEQLGPSTTMAPDVPHSTVTVTQVCPVGYTTTLQTWMSQDCKWLDMTLTPKPALACSTTFSSYMACLPTGSKAPFPSMPNRSQRLVANHAQAAPIITGAPAVAVNSTPQPPVATWTSNDMGGRRSQRLVAQYTSRDLGGRSQRLVGQYTSKDLGGRSQRWVEHEAVPTTSAEVEMGIPCGEVYPCPGVTTLLGSDDEITVFITATVNAIAPDPTTLKTVRKA